MTKDVRFALAGDLMEIRTARNWLRRQLVDLNAEQAEDLVLLTDELVANALQHGSSPREVRLLRRSGVLRIEVDDGSAIPARTRTPSTDGGRGLLLVDALAAGWGQDVRENGKTVWAEFEFTPSP